MYLILHTIISVTLKIENTTEQCNELRCTIDAIDESQKDDYIVIQVVLGLRDNSANLLALLTIKLCLTTNFYY